MKLKILLLMLAGLTTPACVAHVTTSTPNVITVEERPVVCSSRAIRGYERSPCTTFRVVRHVGPPVHYHRYHRGRAVRHSHYRYHRPHRHPHHRRHRH